MPKCNLHDLGVQYRRNVAALAVEWREYKAADAAKRYKARAACMRAIKALDHSQDGLEWQAVMDWGRDALAVLRGDASFDDLLAARELAGVCNG
jgi:hypothetical protein